MASMRRRKRVVVSSDEEDVESQPSTKAPKSNLGVEPRPSIQVPTVNLDVDSQLSTKAPDVTLDVALHPSIQAPTLIIDAELQPSIKAPRVHNDVEPRRSMIVAHVDVDVDPQSSRKEASQNVDAEPRSSNEVFNANVDLEPARSVEVSTVDVYGDRDPSITVFPSTARSSSPAASSASSLSNPSPQPLPDLAIPRRRKRVVVSSDEEEEARPLIKAPKGNLDVDGRLSIKVPFGNSNRDAQDAIKTDKLNMGGLASMTTSSSPAASSASSLSHPSRKQSPDATLDGAETTVVISSGENTPTVTQHIRHGHRHAVSALSSRSNAALLARPTQRETPEPLSKGMNSSRHTEPHASRTKSPPTSMAHSLSSTSAPVRAQASTAQCDAYAELTGEAAVASKRCMDALVQNLGPTVRYAVQGGHTRLIHGVDRHDAPSALKSYQLAGVQWLEALHAANFGCILADEMGLGKTLQVLTFLERQVKDGNTALVVAPVSLLTNWEDEVAKWTNLRVFRYHSANAVARQQLAEQYFALEKRPHVILTSPHVLLNPGDRKAFIKRAGPFSILVCDEGHFLKSSKSSKVINLHKIEASMRILMTGTPIQNDLSELVNLLWFIVPDSFRALRDHFQSRGTLPLELIQKLGAPFILRRLKADVLGDLPAKNVVPIWCHMGETQRKHHDELKRSHCNGVSNDFKSLFSRLRRICNAPIMNQQKFSKESYVELAGQLKMVRADYAAASHANVMREITQWSDYEVHQVAMEYGFKEPFRATTSEIVAGCKIEALLDLLSKRRDRKTLIFSQFTQFLDVLEATLCLSKYTYLRLDGSTPSEERQQLVKKFSAPEGPNVFMLSTKAGGTGLNLVAADACILMDLDFNPQNNRQAEDRIHRLGQTRDVTVYYLLCKDTLEEVRSVCGFRDTLEDVRPARGFRDTLEDVRPARGFRDTLEDKILSINERKINLDEKFGGQKQDVDPKKVIQWIMSSDEP